MKYFFLALMLISSTAYAQPIPGTGGGSSGGAGTEYTEGDTDASFTGPVVLAEGPGNTATALQVDGSKHLQIDIAADSAGLATSANQSTLIGHVDGIEALLTSIDGDTGNISTKIDTLAGAVAGTEFQVDVVTMPSISGTVTCNAGTNLNTSALATSAKQDTIIGHVDGVEGLLTTIDADTGGIATSVALIDGKITACNTGSIAGTVTCNAGTNLNTSSLATETTLGTRLSESDFDSKVGSLTESAPASDTASSGLNGRLQRIAQRITSLIALVPTALTGSGNFKVSLQESNAVQACSQSGTWTVQPGNTPNTSPWLVTLSPATSGGFSVASLVSGASTNATNIKASAGQVFGWYIRNRSAGDRKVMFHNTAGTPTAGSSTFFPIDLPAGSAANAFNDTGIPFSSGIAITTVTGAANSDNAAVSANDLIITIFYK